MTKKSSNRLSRDKINEIMEQHGQQQIVRTQAEFQMAANEVFGKDAEYDVSREHNPIFVLLDMIRVVNDRQQRHFELMNDMIEREAKTLDHITKLQEQAQSLKQAIELVNARQVKEYGETLDELTAAAERDTEVMERLNKLIERIEALEKNAHEPVDILSVVRDELDRHGLLT